MIEVLYDCDLTMGLPDRDVDDGLALLYLLGRPDVRLHGITSTFGNSTLEEVHLCLERTLPELGAAHIPLHRGADGPERGDSPAARFLAETVAANPGRFCLLATGSLTNLADAARLDTGFFAGLARLVVMGGATGPMELGERRVDELNFSADPAAARMVLHSSDRLTVVTGNLCLPLCLERGRFETWLERLRARSLGGFAGYLETKLLPWFAHMRATCGLDGFPPWDATAAVCLTDPELFDRRTWRIAPTLEEPCAGLLSQAGQTAGPASRVHIPARVLDLESYWRVLMESWEEFGRSPAFRKTRYG